MTDQPIKVLLIEDDPGDIDLLRELLTREKNRSYQVESADRLRLGLERLAQGGVDVVLLDLSLPDSVGLDTLVKVLAQKPDIPVVVMTGLDDEATAIRALSEGAQDYVVKGEIDASLVTRSIRYAIERSQLLARLEQSYQAEIRERSRLDRLKDEFVSAVSHELRTPLALIKGSIENVRDLVFGPLTEKQASVLNTINSSIDRLTRIIGDLLDLSRLESGRARIERRRMNLVPLIQETVQNFQTEAEGQKTILATDLPPHLPDAYADADMITQVLNNLLNNALRFAEKKVTVTARVVDLPATSRGLRVSVADDGPGVAPEMREVIFNKFVQLERQAHGIGYKGTGLGLAICKEIIAQHQGKIWVESILGKGSQFHFVLPQYHEALDLRSE